LIAEFKPRSPSRGWLRPEADPGEFAKAYRPAAALSVLCDRAFFGGGPELLRAFRPLVEQPLLAKGFFVAPYQLAQARAAGADAALLIARLLPGAQLEQLLGVCRQLGLEALVEVHNRGELQLALQAGAAIVGVNARDLDTLHIDLAACRRLLAEIPADRVRVAESGLEQRSEIDHLRQMAALGQIDAVLIGTALMTAADPAAAVAALGFA
jgi:indole-3-glycerol phosphate synthase